VKTFCSVYQTLHGNEIADELTRGRSGGVCVCVCVCSQVCWTGANLGDLEAEYK